MCELRSEIPITDWICVIIHLFIYFQYNIRYQLFLIIIYVKTKNRNFLRDIRDTQAYVQNNFDFLYNILCVLHIDTLQSLS